MLDPTYFQVTGGNFLLYPILPEDEELPIFLEWRNLPPGWRAVDSFAGDAVCQSRKTRLIKLTNGLFAGGALRISKTDLEGKTVFTAMRGEWGFSDKSFVDVAGKILSAERKFWNDSDTPNYLITLLPTDDAPGNYGGVALEDSFALFKDRTAKLDFDTKFSIAHEMFHAWNAAKLGEIRGENPFWFTEGFTDYYARTLLLRAGMITAEEYADHVRAAYQEYSLSRVRNVKGKVVQDRFFSDTEVQKLAYLRGDFLAMRWNSQIQERSNGKKSLDDGMLDLFREARSKEIVLSDEFLASHFAAYIGSGAVEDVQKYIEGGETIPRVSEKSQSTGGGAR
jgi:predicted metalloprotease with PDZ domain